MLIALKRTGALSGGVVFGLATISLAQHGQALWAAGALTIALTLAYLRGALDGC